MISYTDFHLRKPPRPAAWNEADRRLFEAMQDIGNEFGDEVHTSGQIDYLVRTLINPDQISVSEPVRNYFLMLVTNDGVDTVSKVGDGEPIGGGALSFDDRWEDEICRRFRSFRDSLDW